MVCAAQQPSLAGDATRVWGAGSKIKQQLLDSASFHAIAGGNAAGAAAARFGGDLRSISNTSIGSQTIISIQGNNNRVEDNNMTSTNRGSVRGDMRFYQ